MIRTVALGLIFGGGGIAVGAVAHAWLVKEAGIVKADAASWAQRLRGVLSKDATSAKNEVTAIIGDIEKKL